MNPGWRVMEKRSFDKERVMQVKIFMVPVKQIAEAEAEMNGFLRSHRVLGVKTEFVCDGENSFWTFCVEHGV